MKKDRNKDNEIEKEERNKRDLLMKKNQEGKELASRVTTLKHNLKRFL